MITISKKLALVIPIETDNGIIYVHSTPITLQTFERYYLVIAKTFNVLYGEGLHVIAGPRVASLTLRNVAETAEVWDGPDGVEIGLMSEIRRLTNCILPTPNGWSTVPFEESRKTMDAEILSEVEGQIVFFILNSAMHRKSRAEAFIKSAARYWGSLTTSLNVTEYAASLPTLTPADSIGVTAKRSSIPS